jgi:hypothetical protein
MFHKGMPSFWHSGQTEDRQGISDASKAALIQVLGVDAIERRATRKLDEPAKNWGWVVTLPVTKKTGVAIFVPRSRQALRLVRLLHVSVWQKAQSHAAKALGDIRPFIMVAMPDGTTDGIVLMSLSEFSELAAMLTSP